MSKPVKFYVNMNTRDTDTGQRLLTHTVSNRIRNASFQCSEMKDHLNFPFHSCGLLSLTSGTIPLDIQKNAYAGRCK